MDRMVRRLRPVPLEVHCGLLQGRKPSGRVAVPSPRAAPRSIAAGSVRVDPALGRGLSCPGCRGQRMTRVLLTLTDGAPGDIVCCQLCDYRAWRFPDVALELDGVVSGFAGQQALFPA